MTEEKLVKMFTDYCERQLNDAKRCQARRDKDSVEHCFTMAYGALMFLESNFKVYDTLGPIWDRYWDEFTEIKRGI